MFEDAVVVEEVGDFMGQRKVLLIVRVCSIKKYDTESPARNQVSVEWAVRSVVAVSNSVPIEPFDRSPQTKAGQPDYGKREHDEDCRLQRARKWHFDARPCPKIDGNPRDFGIEETHIVVVALSLARFWLIGIVVITVLVPCCL